MGVSSLIDYRRPNGEVTAFILEPWYVVLSCSYQFEELALNPDQPYGMIMQSSRFIYYLLKFIFC